jgi:hypothetical protein
VKSPIASEALFIAIWTWSMDTAGKASKGSQEHVIRNQRRGILIL